MVEASSDLGYTNPMLTTQDLMGLLNELNKGKEPKEPTQYRYILYVRKSSESEERQSRSLGDQILDCKKIATDRGLIIAKIIQEAESAKEPDIRPRFREMIDEKNRQLRRDYCLAS